MIDEFVMENESIPEGMLNIKEASKLLEVSEETLIDWDTKNEFKAEIFRDQRMYPLTKIREYMNVELNGLYNPRITSNSYIKELLNKWDDKGYLSELDDFREKKILSVLLENCEKYKNFCSLLEHLFSIDQSLWLTQQIWLRSKMKTKVSIQPMEGPSSIVYFKEIKNKHIYISTEAVGAKSQRYDLEFLPSDKWDDYKHIYANCIADELDQIISNKINPRVNNSDIFSKPIFCPYILFLEEYSSKNKIWYSNIRHGWLL